MKKLDHATINQLIDRKIAECNTNGSTLSKERENVLKYYNGELPKRQHDGSSTYVSTDVFDIVEGFKAQLIELFRGNHEIVRFDPQQPTDVVDAQIATDYTSYVFFRQNNGDQIMSDTIDDALKARVGIVKVFWDEDREYQDETFENVDPAALSTLADTSDEITEIESEIDPLTGLATGTLTRVKSDISQVRIEVIAPEMFLIDPRAKCLKGWFHGNKCARTLSEIEQMGFDVKKLRDQPADADDSTDDLETIARFAKTNDGYGVIDNDVPDELRKYWVYEVYLDLPVNGAPKLHKVVKVGKTILDIQEVDRSPFKVYVPMRNAHAFHGDNFAARIIPYQNARTTLARGILDHTAVATNPRMQVLAGSLPNPRELLDKRMGGIINTTRPDAIMPVAQPNLNPFVFQMLQTMKEASENTTGVSSLSQGLNKDAISKQNSAEMVEQLVGLSMLRQKAAAREFSIFICEVFVEIYRLVIENEKRKRIFEVAGKWQEVDPQRWIERRSATPSMHLGAGEVQQEIAKYTGLVSAAQNPQIAAMLGPKGGYNLMTKILKLQGIKNTDDYLTPPDKLPPKQPDPLQMAQVEMAKKQVEIQQFAAETTRMEAMAAIELQKAKLEIDKLNAEITRLTKLADSQRKGMESAQRVDTAQRELAMAENELENNNADARTIISPS